MISLQQEMSQLKQRIDERLLKLLEDKKKIAGDSYNKGLYNLLIDFAMRGGKRLRPILMIESYKACGGKDMDAIIDASLSMELIENYLLIHDDIIDRDYIRRGGPSFHKMVERLLEKENDELKIDSNLSHFGISGALIGGDVFSTLSIIPILKSTFPAHLKIEALKECASACEQCFKGELIDVIMEKIEDVDEEELLRMIDLKTGSYTTCLPLVVGGIFGGFMNLSVLRDYGMLIGRAFQIRDDILGTFGENKKTGKPTSSDIRQGKKTLLVIYALKEANSKDRKFLSSKLGKDLNEKDMSRIKQIISDCGALEYSLDKIEDYSTQAKEKLLSSSLKSKDFFIQFADYLTTREF